VRAYTIIRISTASKRMLYSSLTPRCRISADCEALTLLPSYEPARQYDEQHVEAGEREQVWLERGPAEVLVKVPRQMAW